MDLSPDNFGLKLSAVKDPILIVIYEAGVEEGIVGKKGCGDHERPLDFEIFPFLLNYSC